MSHLPTVPDLLMAVLVELENSTSLLGHGKISRQLKPSLITLTGMVIVSHLVSLLNLYFLRFGGLAIDLNKPGTIMAATLNLWWPDANIFRSLDGGVTWSPIWEWAEYPTINRYFGVDFSLTPWLGNPLGNQDTSLKLVGWWIETMV
jgi:hypothetical protein